MKKKLLALALALCMVISLMPVTALATEGTGLPTADGNGTITISESTTINDVTISSSELADNVPLLKVTGSGTVVTIEGGTISTADGAGLAFAILVDEGATLNLNNVTVTGTAAGIKVANGSTLTVNGGAITGTGTTAECGDGIRAYDSAVKLMGNVEINGSAVGNGVELYNKILNI